MLGIVQALQGALLLLQQFPAEVDWIAVMGGEHKEPHYLRVKLLDNIPHGKEIAQGFGHFTVVHIDIAVMQPVAGKGFAGKAFTLGNFIFMVGEN